MRRCVLELLALHRNFLSQIQANKASETDQEKRAPLTVYRSLEVAFQVLVIIKAVTFMSRYFNASF
jgi:Fe2+ or Zn2+ uptake regulation protein